MDRRWTIDGNRMAEVSPITVLVHRSLLCNAPFMATPRALRSAVLAVAFVLGVGFLAGATSGSTGREGGIFRIAGVPDAIDPAITLDAGDALAASCVRLMSYPDKPWPRGTRVVPEAAAAYPDVSRDGKTYTFTVRDGFRFNTGEKVTAQSFAHAIVRIMSPAAKAAWVQYVQDIAGAQAVMDGKAAEPTGVKARQNKLSVRLTHAARDFPARTSFYAFCAVPSDLPISEEGVSELPGAGPYYIADFVTGQKLVLKRNPFYRGSRPHHFDEIDFASAPDNVRAVESGAADYAELNSPADVAHLALKFRPQLHSVPGFAVRYVVLNNSRRLFKDNLPLRRAVNFALERRALLKARSDVMGTLTDQYLPPGMTGFVDAHVFPLRHPDMRKAKALARGHTRSGKAMLYIKDDPTDIAQSQIIRRDLKQIGIDVSVKKLPGPALFQKLFTPGTPYDMTLLGFGPDYSDPYAVLDTLFDGRMIGTPYTVNLAYFNSAKYNSILAADSKLTGSARYAAYGKLDVDLARNAAPMVAYASESALTFVSRKIGCIVLNPFLDLAAACTK
jgi:peptide/nickel transport system substrate-binding protein